MQERRERLAGRAPVQALERAVVEHAVDPPHLLVEDGVERAALGQDLAHDAVAVLVRPALRGLRGDARAGHALGLLVPAAFLALVPFQLTRDGRNRVADPGGNVSSEKLNIPLKR